MRRIRTPAVGNSAARFERGERSFIARVPSFPVHLLLAAMAYQEPFQERRVATLPEGAWVESLQSDPEGRVVVCSVWHEGRAFVFRNGAALGPYDEVGEPVLSPDGSAVLFRARRGNRWRVVCGEEGPEFREISQPRFLPDGKTPVYKARRDRQEQIVCGGTLFPPAEAVSDPLILPDGTIAYAAKSREGWRVFVGESAGEAFEQIRDLTSSGDGRILAYAARRRGRWFAVIGGKPGAEFDEVDSLTLSGDGRVVCYRVRTGSRRRIVAGDSPGEPFDRVSPPVLLPDGSAAAYIASDGAGEFVIAGGRRTRAHGSIGSFQVGRDGVVAYSAKDGEAWRVFRGPWQSEAFDEIPGPILLSPAEDRIAFRARRGQRWFLQVGEECFGPYQGCSLPWWGNGSFFFRARRNGRYFVAWPGGRSRRFDRIGALTVDPDGSRVAFAALDGRDVLWKVVKK